MQLDADEDGEPFFKPQQVNAAPTASSKPKKEGDVNEHTEQSPGIDDQGRGEGETAQAAAATTTAEQED